MIKVKALTTFHVPSLPEFVEGSEYFVEESLSATLIERQLVEAVSPKKDNTANTAETKSLKK